MKTNRVPFSSRDAVGNITLTDKSVAFTYNAWNQIVDAAGTANHYDYDALGRRIKQGDNRLLVSPAGQVLEERGTTNNVLYQYIWSQGTSTTLVSRARFNSKAEVDQVLHALTDGQGNVVATVDDTWAVQERIAYNPNGEATFYNSSYNPKTNGVTTMEWWYGADSDRWDAKTQLVYKDGRDWSPRLMVFIAFWMGPPIDGDPIPLPGPDGRGKFDPPPGSSSFLPVPADKLTKCSELSAMIEDAKAKLKHLQALLPKLETHLVILQSDLKKLVDAYEAKKKEYEGNLAEFEKMRSKAFDLGSIVQWDALIVQYQAKLEALRVDHNVKFDNLTSLIKYQVGIIGRTKERIKELRSFIAGAESLLAECLRKKDGLSPIVPPPPLIN